MSETTAARYQFSDSKEKMIVHTKQWVDRVIVRLNICPFAKAEVQAQSIHYKVQDKASDDEVMQSLLAECKALDQDASRATTLFILNMPALGFYSYLDLLDLAESTLVAHGYEGVYQLASFHPQYCFGGSDDSDAANYTNRAPYPMFHLIREEDISKALATFLHPESIPERNIEFTRRKGAMHMNQLLMSCYTTDSK